MTPIRIQSAIQFLLLAATLALPTAARAEVPELQEVLDVIRSRAGGVTEAELNRAAVVGLISELGTQVQLITNTAAQSAAELTITRSEVFDDQIGYVRIAQVGAGLPEALRLAYQQLHSSNKISGLVLDLRYANGTDYAAAVGSADLFISTERPLLKWEAEVLSTKQKSDAIQLPLAILVNNGTSGAAEALAAVLRSTGAGLILGSRTAGKAFVVRDHTLKNGAILRVGTYPVSLANGTALSTNGVKPDIDITVNPDDERIYYADAFSVSRRTNTLSASSLTNQLSSRGARFDEAELVRQHRAGLRRNRDVDEELPVRSAGNSQSAGIRREGDSETPLVSDPALARALDLLKGLAVVRQSRL